MPKKSKDNTIWYILIVILIIFLFIIFTGGTKLIIGDFTKEEAQNPNSSGGSNMTFCEMMHIMLLGECPFTDDAEVETDTETDEGGYETEDEPSCQDTDGGDYILIYGECTDVDGTTADVCPLGQGTDYVSEAYCIGDTCSGSSQLCPEGTWCWDGKCQTYAETERPCASIWNPSESECSLYGVCDEEGYICVYVENELFGIDECECQPEGGWN